MHSVVPPVHDGKNHIDGAAAQNGGLVKPDSDGKSYRGGGPESGCRSQTPDLIAFCHHDGARAQKADAADHLCAHPHRVAGIKHLIDILVCQHNQAGSDADQHIRPQASRSVFHAPLHANDAAQRKGGKNAD